jgi:CheY-like chemotaxis protein/anti-sigma regulatory factor (Ser/Thr protein kinase)
VEAGKTVVRPAEFQVENLFGALRGMLRPLLMNQSVSLVFEDTTGLRQIYSDEGKVSQILRNLISNALKFTERGEVRVAAREEEPDLIAFTVADTGIGIEPRDQTRIFEEFSQVEHRLQAHVKGTGLGLPLSRRLAELLGGTLGVDSEPGIGSTFTLTLPRRYMSFRSATDEEFAWELEVGNLPLLVVEDAPDAQYFYEKVLRSSAYQIYPAYTLHDAENALQQMRPAAIILDIVLGPENAWDLLVRLRRHPKTSETPIVVVSSGGDRDKAIGLGADAYLPKPVERRSLIDTLTRLQGRTIRPIKVLTIDDDEVARYLVRQCLPAPAFDVIEATGGENGLVRARDEHPDVVLLDLMMPGMDGWQVLEQLRKDAATRTTPVVIVTSHTLEPAQRDGLHEAFAVVSKQDLSRSTLAPVVQAAAEKDATRQDEAIPPLSL